MVPDFPGEVVVTEFGANSDNYQALFIVSASVVHSASTSGTHFPMKKKTDALTHAAKEHSGHKHDADSHEDQGGEDKPESETTGETS
jgi:hypothetical protein